MAISRSLEKLGLDQVDLYLIHWPCPATGLYVETWEQLIDFRSEGLTRSIGVSNFLPEHLDALLDETGITPSVNQIELHPTFQPDDLINHCSDLGIAVTSWSPLGASADLEHPEILDIAKATGATPAQVIIRWHLKRGFVVIPKSTNPERIQANFAALDVELDSDQMGTIDALSAGNRSPGTKRTSYSGRQPIRNGDVANLATDVLDLPRGPPSASSAETVSQVRTLCRDAQSAVSACRGSVTLTRVSDLPDGLKLHPRITH